MFREAGSSRIEKACWKTVHHGIMRKEDGESAVDEYPQTGESSMASVLNKLREAALSLDMLREADLLHVIHGVSA